MLDLCKAACTAAARRTVRLRLLQVLFDMLNVLGLRFTAHIDCGLRVLQVLSEKMDVLRLAFYTAPISCSVLLPLFFVREVSCCPVGSGGLPGWQPIQ